MPPILTKNGDQLELALSTCRGSEFQDAKEKISLIDGAALVDKITTLPPETALELLRFATEGDYQTPTCPACAIKMIKRKSTTHGRAYWGCLNYPACKHTFFIG